MWLIYFPFPSSFSLILLLFLNIIMTFLRIVICLYKITIYNHLVMPNNLRHYLVSVMMVRKPGPKRSLANRQCTTFTFIHELVRYHFVQPNTQ